MGLNAACLAGTLLFACSLAGAAVGCGGDEGMVLSFEDAVAAEDFGRLEVAISVSETGNSGWCAPWIRGIDTPSVDIAIEQPSTSGAHVAFRVRTERGDEILAQRFGEFAMTPGEVTHHGVMLDRSCLLAAPCGDDQECAHGQCADSEWSPFFERSPDTFDVGPCELAPAP